MAPRRTTKQAKKTKMIKLEAFLADFDIEVETRLARLEETRDQMVRDLRNAYTAALIKLPTSVRKRNWMEHFRKKSQEVENLKSPEADDAKGQEEAAIVENVLKSAKKISKKNCTAKSKNPSDENSSRNLRKGKTTRRPPTTSKKAKPLSVIRRSSRNAVVTPARTLLDSSLMGQTPLITPRFDPRLPKTPAVRVPHHKERVFSISANGSPISADNEDVVLSVPVGNGESIQLLASQVDSVDLTQLGETALRSIRRLQNRLTTLCES